LAPVVQNPLPSTLTAPRMLAPLYTLASVVVSMIPLPSTRAMSRLTAVVADPLTLARPGAVA